jgi:hypothetical protein
MKNPIEVLRMKEQEMSRIEREVEALQITARLLSDDSVPSNSQEQNPHHEDVVARERSAPH